MAKKRQNPRNSSGNKLAISLMITVNLLTWFPFVILFLEGFGELMKDDALSKFMAIVFVPIHILVVLIFAVFLNWILLKIKTRCGIIPFLGITLIFVIMGGVWWSYSFYNHYYDPTLIAVVKGDYKICEQINIPSRKDDFINCYIKVATALQDPQACNNSALLLWTTDCYASVAKAMKNYSICDSLEPIPQEYNKNTSR